MRYTLQLFFDGATHIDIPGFASYRAASLAGLFLQTLRVDIYLFEVREVAA